MLHDPKTVIGSDFDQETAEKIAPQFIPRLELANCINDDINGDEDDDYADVCLEHRSQGGGGALMSSCPKLRRTFAQTCLRPANLQELCANNQTIPLHRSANQENLGKFYFCFSLQIMSLISRNNPMP